MLFSIIGERTRHEDLSVITRACGSGSEVEKLCERDLSLLAICRARAALPAATAFGPGDVKAAALAEEPEAGPYQDLSIQEAAVRAAGCEVIRIEKRSGTTTEGRAELQTVLDFLRKGDVLMVTRVDRLARSIGDLQDIVRALKARGAALKATEQPIDTSTAAGKCFLDMLGVFAEFETNLRRERQAEGIAKAKKAGIYRGRKPSVDAVEVKRVKAEGLGASQIAKRLKIGRASVYRVLEA